MLALRTAPRLGPLLLALPLAALAGCGGAATQEAYPTEVLYPLRTDRLVLKTPSAPQPQPHAPGKLDHAIAELDKLGGETLDPAGLDAGQRRGLANALNDVFGRPAKPWVDCDHDDTEAYAAIGELKLDDEDQLRRGSALYRRHCLSCHGLPGNGRGPTGPWVHPPPRDFRQGQFKFVASAAGAGKPRRDDLLRVLLVGVEGTSMPPFNLLPRDELEALVSYVMHLSLRGQVEYVLMRQLLEGNAPDGELVDAARAQSATLLKAWRVAQRSPAEPTGGPADEGDERLDRVRRGYRLFTDTAGAASCINCHKDFGRQVEYNWDAWGTLVRPANLTTGQYRGGRRPLDLYHRVRAGVPPSGMPGSPALPEDDVWALLAFLDALPYPARLPDEVRDRVYGERPKE